MPLDADDARQPVPTRRDEIDDVLHGVRIADPYRWLEDGDRDEVRAWSAAQTRRTEAILRALPEYPAIAARVAALLRTGAVEAPVVVGSRTGVPRYFHRRQRPEDDQPILFVREGLRGDDRALVDPARRGTGGTTALDWWAPSPDGRLLAYGLSSGGDEDSTLRVLDVATGLDLGAEDVIPRTRHASIAWLPDGSGFYYSRHPELGSVPAGEERYRKRIHLHRIGRDPREDPVVFGDGRALTDIPLVELSPSGRWLVVMVHVSWSRREAFLRDRERPDAGFVPLAVPEHDGFYEVTPYDDHLLVRTNDGAPNGALYRVDPERLDRRAWELVVPESRDVIVGALEVGGDLFVLVTRDARSAILRFGARGEPKGEVPLPGLGTVTTLRGEPEGRELFFDYGSFATPSSVRRLDLVTSRVEPFAEVPSPLEADVVVEQRFATSRDGTRVPFFVVRRPDVPLDGSAPALLTGYGGFNLSQMPQWMNARGLLVERGGSLVVANLRGGGEYGEAWHQGGMLARKQNVFDDLFAVAEQLVRERITSPERLALFGGSNGGLLVGAAITQRPELFRAAVCAVPLLDMLRYHRFLIAKLWIPEYGSADDPDAFRWLHAYSPYHRVVPGARYPAVLFTTAEGDSRVDPLHARKMAALLQWAGEHVEGAREVLLRVEQDAGHGAGKPVSKRVDEYALVYAFLLSELGIAHGSGAPSAPRR